MFFLFAIVDIWPNVRAERDNKISAVQFEYDRNSREQRLLLTHTRSIEWMISLDVYVQELADIPQTFEGIPEDVVWPTMPI